MSASTDVRATSHGVIAILLPCLLTGGTEVATLETARALQVLRYAVEVVVYFDEIDSTMLNTFQQAGLAVRLLGVRRTGGFRTHARLSVRLLKALAGRRYQAIWVQYMTPTLLPLAVARIFTRNLIASVHVASSHFEAGALNRLRWLTRYWCDRMVCVSNTTARGVFSDKDYGNKVAVIPNALDVAEAQQVVAWDWRQKLGWPADCVVVGFAGRLAAIKGVDILLQSMVQLQGAFPQLRVVVVGDGAERASLQAFVASHGLGESVYFAGRLTREEVLGAIKGFDWAAVPSREEGFGLSALESMAVGVPVIASRVHALEEVVMDGKTGLLFEAGNPIALSECLASVMRLTADRPDWLAALGQQASEHARANYDVANYRANLKSLLETLDEN